MSATKDLKEIAKIRDRAIANSIVKRVLTEVSVAAAKVNRYVAQDSSGYAVAFYDIKTGKPTGYQVNYQPGNAGNLVHELTHVACAEAYNQDFVNYPSTAVPRTVRTYDAQGRCTNEATRQDEWKLAGGGGRDDILKTLVGQVRGLDFGSLQVKKTFTSSDGRSAKVKVTESLTQLIVDKLNYGISKPHIEFDTVINQILVWLVEWGYPKKGYDANNGFYYGIENAAKIAWHQRRAGAPARPTVASG